MPTITLEHEFEIGRPIGQVFDYLSDHERLPAWTAGVKRVSRTSPGPIGVGTTYRVIAKMLGRRVRSTYVITAYEPDKQLAGRTTSPILSFEETYRFEAGDDGRTVVRLNLEAQPLRWLRLLGPLLAVGMHRQVPADHRRLCTLLERSGPAGAPARAGRTGGTGRLGSPRSGGGEHEDAEPGHEDDPGKGDAGE